MKKSGLKKALSALIEGIIGQENLKRDYGDNYSGPDDDFADEYAAVEKEVRKIAARQSKMFICRVMIPRDGYFGPKADQEYVGIVKAKDKADAEAKARESSFSFKNATIEVAPCGEMMQIK